MKRIGYRFSKFELTELAKAWAALSLAFTILYTGINFVSLEGLIIFLVSALTVGTGFLFHELGHKFVAQKYGLWAEFRASNQGLMLAIVMSFFGFIFAAPGAVVIHGHTSLGRNGKIALAGPLVNYGLALLFMIGGLLNPVATLGILFSYGATINAILGLFNLIPFFIFDGAKIVAWNKVVYGAMVVAGFLLVGISLI